MNVNVPSPDGFSLWLPVKTSPLKGLKNDIAIPLSTFRIVPFRMRYISSLKNALGFPVPLWLCVTFFSMDLS